jgi:hypothetical protein
MPGNALVELAKHIGKGDFDATFEAAFAQGVARGTQAERERIKAILELSAPAGLEKAAIVMALSGSCSVEAVAGLIALYAVPPAPVTAAEVKARRAALKLIDNENITESDHASKAP